MAEPPTRKSRECPPITRRDEIATLLGISPEEAEQVMADDKAIDRGEKLFELTPEQKQAEKKMRLTGTRKPFVPDLKPRERKTDQEKHEIVEYLAAALKMLDCEITVTNPERQIDFEFKGRKMRVVLSAPRK